MKHSIFFLFIISLLGMTSVCRAESWQVIEQPMFRVIFQPEIQQEAERVADHLNNYLNNHLSDMPIDGSFKKIAVVLHNQSHVSNGNVNLAPYESHWYNKPTDAGTEWFETLAVHEGRHMVQFNQIFDKPTARVLHFFTGQASGLVIGTIFLPQWFYEGDAVISETNQTSAGRGRMASFDLWFRTATLNEPLPTYEQAMLGTGFDNVPYQSPYVFGYYMTAYLQKNYGADLFETAIDELLGLDGFNLNGVIKHQTGKNLSEHYRDMMKALKVQWQTELDHLTLTDITPLDNAPQNHWNSLYPIYAQDDQVYAVEIDLEDGYFITKIQNRTYQRLVSIPDTVASSFLSTYKSRAVSGNGHQFCWVDIIPNLTKPYQETGELFCWQPETDLQQLSRGEKFTSAAISQQEILAHRFNTDRTSELVLLDSHGKTLKTLSLPIRSLAYDISATKNGWVFVLSGSDKNGIYFVDHELSSLTRLLATNDEILRSPTLTENWLVFTSDNSGIDQLYAYSQTDDLRYQIATRPYGTYFPVWNEQRHQLVFSDYSATGHRLVAVDILDSQQGEPGWQPVTETLRDYYSEPVISNPPAKTPQSGSYQAGKYSVTDNLIRPYLWGGSYTNNRVAAIIVSEDTLDKLNLTASAGYEFDQEDWIGAISADYRTDAGPHLVFSSAKDYSDEEKERQNQISLYQTYSQRFGTESLSWTPAIGFATSQTDNQDTDQLLVGSINYTRTKDAAFHDISSPFSFSQTFTLARYLNHNDTDAMTNSELSFNAPGRYAAIDLAADIQYLSSDNELLTDSALFETPDETGLTAQLSADYRFNSGGTGMNLSHLAYWRNTEISFNTRAQISDQKTETAIGFTIAPSLNLLRNSWLQASPAFSAFYALDESEIKLLMTISVGN